MKKLVITKRKVCSLIFNIAETILIFLIGKSLDLPIKNIIMIMLTFMISRGCFGKALHFKTWYRCLVWSALIMLSLFVLFKVDLIVSIMFAIFSAFIMTGKSNIYDIYLWNNNNEPSKYQDILDYVKYNEFNDKLIEFETKLQNKDNLDYLIYKYRFKEQRTFNEISELLDMDTPRISEHQSKIAFAIRLYCGI